MAFPTNSTRRSLASALDRAQSQADTLKRQVTDYRASMVGGPVTGSLILALLDTMRHSKTVFAQTSALPGIGDFAQEQLGQSVGAEFTAMVNAIDNAGAWIISNFPKDAGGFLLERTIAADGARTERTFTSAQTAGLRTLLDALTTTID